MRSLLDMALGLGLAEGMPRNPKGKGVTTCPPPPAWGLPGQPSADRPLASSVADHPAGDSLHLQPQDGKTGCYRQGAVKDPGPPSRWVADSGSYRPTDHHVGSASPSLLVGEEGGRRSAVAAKTACQAHGVLYGLTATLAEVGTHRVNGVTQKRHGPRAPVIDQ